MIYISQHLIFTYEITRATCENNQVYLFRKILVISINAMLMMMKAIFPVMVINIRNDLLNISTSYSLMAYLSFAFATLQTLSPISRVINQQLINLYQAF